MKVWTLAALLAGMLVGSLVMRGRKHQPASKRSFPDQLYSIDDLIADQPMS
jgi:uncharacterized membrane-anchored protein YhcB (DUF1043 family)